MPPEPPRPTTLTELASVVRPEGPGAALIADLWWVMFWIAAAVCAAVLALLLIGVFKGRTAGARFAPRAPLPRPPGEGDAEPFGAPREDPRWSTPLVLLGGVAVPAVVLVSLLVYSLRAHAALAVGEEEPLTVEVVGHQWWWEVRYPDRGFTTANEVVLPVGREARLLLTSVDVIHSLWAPNLNGKMDLVPGQFTELPLEASRPGVFWAACAEYCGLQHAKMNLVVRALEPADYTVWADAQALAAAQPQQGLAAEGLQVFLGSACVYCHTVRGTNASGRAGPDLTHVASRLTLGAGAVPNTRGNLAGWVVNSQTTKPGNRMPPMYVSGPELQALLAYLETLR